MKAFILAAGRGERLRPLTERIPKPMVQAGGRPLIAWHLERLARAGLKEVVINVSHLAQAITGFVGEGAAFGLRVVFSHEAEPLETAGAIAFARELLGPAPFLLVNGDIYAECDFAQLRTQALGRDLARLVMVPNPAHRQEGDFSLLAGRVGNGAAARYTYAGIAVVDPALVADVAAGTKAPLVHCLRTAAAAGRIAGELYEGPWCDVGTAERLQELEAMLRARGTRR